MAFLQHLAIIFCVVYTLVLLFSYSHAAIFFAVTLICGYIGSSAGLGGTVLGLLSGAVLGGLLAGALELLLTLARFFADDGLKKWSRKRKAKKRLRKRNADGRFSSGSSTPTQSPDDPEPVSEPTKR